MKGLSYENVFAVGSNSVLVDRHDIRDYDSLVGLAVHKPVSASLSGALVLTTSTDLFSFSSQSIKVEF